MNEKPAAQDLSRLWMTGSVLRLFRLASLGYITVTVPKSESPTHIPCFDEEYSPSRCCRPGKNFTVASLAYGDLPLRRDDPRWTARPSCFDAKMTFVECCALGMARWRVGDRRATGESQDTWELKHLYSSALEEHDFWGTVVRIISDKRDPMGWQRESYVDLGQSRYRELIADNAHGLRDDMFFVDVGCSVGTVSILFLLRFPRSRGICIEVSSARVNYVAWNLRVNGIAAERLRVVHGAVGGWQRSGGGQKSYMNQFTATETPEYMLGGARTPSESLRYDYVAPPDVDLEAEVGAEHVDVLKINCEGCMFGTRLPKAGIYAGDFEHTDTGMWAIDHLRWASKDDFLRSWTEKYRLVCEDKLQGRHFLGCEEAREQGFVDEGARTLWL